MRWLAAALVVVALAAPVAATTTPTPSQPAIEAVPVQGGGSPADAPRLASGNYLDLIRQPETLWYALEATAGQQVAAVVVIRGRPEGPLSDDSALRLEVLDAQRQPSGVAGEARFTGQADARAEVISQPLSAVTAGQGDAFMTVSLTNPRGAVDLADVGYQVEFAVQVSGEPVAGPIAPPTPDPAGTGPAEPSVQVLDLESAPRNPVVATLPVSLLSFGICGAIAFEVARGRRRRR